jgi:2-amino-4-hydroxy-6-hydroxymethyldihydropteridine diphosphokinase
MSLIIATGSNLGSSRDTLALARIELSKHFKLIAQSRLYRSKAVDYESQPDFINQVLEFELPQDHDAPDILALILSIEASLGRQRTIPKGPRTIDIDLLFFGLDHFSSDELVLPHPRLWNRSFVVRPLKELPFFATLDKHFTFPDQFAVEAFPL